MVEEAKVICKVFKTLVSDRSDFGDEFLHNQIQELRRLQNSRPQGRLIIEFRPIPPKGQCDQCQKYVKTYERNLTELGCGHKLCSRRCLRLFIQQSARVDLLQDLYDIRKQIGCKVCQSIIPKAIFKQAFDKHEFENKDIDCCHGCYTRLPLDQIITLPNCRHQLCEPCLHNYLKHCIDKFLVQGYEMVCPYINCGRPLKRKFIFEHINDIEEKEGQGIKQTYLERVAIGRKIGKQNLIHCPNKNCNMPLPRGEQNPVTCNYCNHVFCPDCKNEQHDGVACEEFIEQNGLMPQPLLCILCNEECWKWGQSNYIVCHSQRCKRKKFFCALCMAELNSNDKLDHFLGKPMGENCINHQPYVGYGDEFQ